MEDINKEKNDEIVENVVSEETESAVSENTVRTTDEEALYANFKNLDLTFEKFAEIRKKYNVPTSETCSKCGKKFKNDTKIYTADKILNSEIKQVIICSKCAKKD